MPNLQNQNCPLCGQKAKFNLNNFEQDKYFDCSYCTQYVLSTMAEEKLNASSVSVREDLSKMAKDSPEGQFLLIRLEAGEIEAIYTTRI